MQRIDATAGEIIYIGSVPIGIERACGNRVRLVAPSCIEESAESLRRAMRRSSQALDTAAQRRKTNTGQMV
jgi:hypothetical protein